MLPTTFFYIIMRCVLWLLSHPFQTCSATLFYFFVRLSSNQHEDGVLLLMGLLLSSLCDFFLNFLHLFKAKQWIYACTGLLTGGVLGYTAQSLPVQIFAGLCLAIACVWQAQRNA